MCALYPLRIQSDPRPTLQAQEAEPYFPSPRADCRSGRFIIIIKDSFNSFHFSRKFHLFMQARLFRLISPPVLHPSISWRHLDDDLPESECELRSGDLCSQAVPFGRSSSPSFRSSRVLVCDSTSGTKRFARLYTCSYIVYL